MKSALTLIFSFISLIFVVAAVADESQKVHVDYSMSRHGSSVCKDAKIILVDEEVLLCEGTSAKSKNKIFLKATVKKISESSYRISAKIEEIDSDSVVKVISSPIIETVANETSEMTSSTGGPEIAEKEQLTKFSVTVNSVF